MARVPEEKTLLRLGQEIGAETIREMHDRIVGLAQERRVIQGRKLRVDTTVVESNIHYPTDSGLLNDGARVLTRTMKQIEGKAGSLKKKVRNRMRTVTKRVIAIAHALRHKGAEGELKRKREYRQLLRVTRQILNVVALLRHLRRYDHLGVAIHRDLRVVALHQAALVAPIRTREASAPVVAPLRSSSHSP